MTNCNECGSWQISFDENRGDYICSHCGLVQESGVIDHGAEWRAFDNEQYLRRSRTGAPSSTLVHDKGLSTVIDWRNKDAYGRDISSNMRAQVYRIRKWQSRIRISDSFERNLTFALGEIERMSSNLSLSKGIRESSAKIYRKAVKAKIIRGRSIEGVVAAAIYAACKEHGFPRTLSEVSLVANVKEKDIGRNYRFINISLELELGPSNPVTYIPRFSSVLELSQKCQSKATDILKEVVKKGLTSGRGPTGIAAAAIYVASLICKERRTQREIARVANVTEVTVRNRFKEITRVLNIKY